MLEELTTARPGDPDPASESFWRWRLPNVIALVMDSGILDFGFWNTMKFLAL